MPPVKVNEDQIKQNFWKLRLWYLLN